MTQRRPCGLRQGSAARFSQFRPCLQNTQGIVCCLLCLGTKLQGGAWNNRKRSSRPGPWTTNLSTAQTQTRNEDDVVCSRNNTARTALQAENNTTRTALWSLDHLLVSVSTSLSTRRTLPINVRALLFICCEMGFALFCIHRSDTHWCCSLPADPGHRLVDPGAHPGDTPRTKTILATMH